MITKLTSVYLFAGIMLLSYLFVNSFIKGKSSYARMLGILSVVLQIYLMGYLMEINAGSLDEMLFWNQIQYFGIPFFPGLWMAVSMLYTGRGKYLQGLSGFLIFLIPIITFIMRLTNEWHHLYYSHIEIQRVGEAELMLLTKGPWYIVQMCYVLILLVLCTGFYFQRYRRSIGNEKMQFKLLFSASVLPYIALVLVTINIGGIGIDYTALILPPCVLLINLAVSRYNFLEIKALAREKVFVDSTSGLVLLNRLFRVVDFNEAGRSFFRWFDVQIKEEQLDTLLVNQQELLESIRGAVDKIFHLFVDGEERFVGISIRGVQHKEETLGSLITLEDVTERELLKRQLMEIANTDVLSGLFNRRKFREGAEEAYQRARRYREPISVLMMDIDYFKKINDSFGHFIGDAVIRSFSETLSEVFRGTDIVGRMGGEEFAVVMLNANAEQAYKKAEYFRKQIEKKIMVFDGREASVTVSIGVAERMDETPNFDSLLNRADHELYEAKRGGRNCTRL